MFILYDRVANNVKYRFMILKIKIQVNITFKKGKKETLKL